jgi:DNA-binding NarL/FixJ family response regulator
MAERIPISILSDSRLFCATMAARLKRDPSFEPIATASTVHSLLVQLDGRPVDILLVHADAESFAGGVIWEIKTLLPAARVIVLQYGHAREACDDNDEAVRWIEAGAAAYLPCSASYVALRETMCALAENRLTCSPQMLVKVIERTRALAEVANSDGDRCPSRSLSLREAEIAGLVNRGLVQSKEIARELGVRPSTVDSHIESILQKLHLNRRSDLLRRDGPHNRWEVG